VKKASFLPFLLSLVAGIAAHPAYADSMLYSNGTLDGQDSNATINGRTATTDSFTLGQNSTVTGVSFAVWVEPGVTVQTVDWSIGASAFGGTAATASTTNSFLFLNGQGLNVYEESISIPSLSLDAGTYYLTLQNAIAMAVGNPSHESVYWDMNSGPSTAYQKIEFNGLPFINQIPSETFAIYGTQGGPGGAPGSMTPEPSSFLLLGSGLVGFAGLVRRKRRA
jgi:hypothetical protein